MRELSSRGASRRRIPTLARMRGSGAYHPYMDARSSVETISSVSSSWLRRNVLHCAPAGMSGVSARISRTWFARWSRIA
ncbi:Uncharacterised protein [Mycobacteroides abscessus]|nr:Uncharacterised protein [Mycobacteroides abscessus]